MRTKKAFDSVQICIDRQRSAMPNAQYIKLLKMLQEEIETDLNLYTLVEARKNNKIDAKIAIIRSQADNKNITE